MKKFIVCCFSIIVAEIFTFAATDQGAKIDPFDAELLEPRYFADDDHPNGVEFLPPPPGWTSDLFTGDYVGYLWGKTVRGTERGKKAVIQSTFLVDDFIALFNDAFGYEISREKTPAIYKVLRKSLITARLSSLKPKGSFKRTRPYVRYNEPTPVPETEERLRNNGSYPSGHSLRGWCMALLLLEINPECQNKVLKLGHEWGESRVIIGYHWKSDVEAGRALASAVYARLHTSEEFLSDMAAAREEFKRIKNKSEKADKK
jgi:acid phosphatase (class A)